MAQFQGKGSFPKRGEKPLKAIVRVEPANDADAFHLGQVELTDGLPIPAPRERTNNSAAESDDAESGGADGLSFSAFDDLLATSTVGRK